MKLTHLSNERVIIARLMPVSGSRSKLALSTVTAAFGTLQPLGLEKTLRAGGVPGALYKIFLEFDVDVQEGDQLKDEDGNVYTVRKGGVTKWRHGAMDYREVYLTKS